MKQIFRILFLILTSLCLLNLDISAQFNLLGYKKDEIKDTCKRICELNNELFTEYNDVIAFEGESSKTYCYFNKENIFNLCVIMPNGGNEFLYYIGEFEKNYKVLSPFKWYYEIKNESTLFSYLVTITVKNINFNNKEMNVFEFKLIE
ncbi:hypothetical protein IR083_09730 [Dysgonomonas sp. GY75]|uniref:hypothetical protein n=1 Tax=Dysgonomonas sp. GY75 TaxID=2780419 RepID=UPI0018842DC6|nr:hypothetical protein [Dysgonomonas sp. GY75]MBF0649099.1 hypothetical protein [Dysgonomonas sp. GY75]